MTVYIEYAIADNLTMDFFLLFAACVTLKLPFSVRRTLLGAVAGTACALLCVNLRGFWLYASRGLCLFLMCAVTVGFGKKLFWYILLTLAYTFVTGGAIIGIFNLLNVQYIAENGLYYQMRVPLFVYVLSVCAVAFLCYSIAVYVRQSVRFASLLKRVNVRLSDNVYTVRGFCDSGNTVTCDGAPVCFVTKNFGNFSQWLAGQILLGNSRRVEVSTLTGTMQVCAAPAVLCIGGVEHNVFLALPAEKCRTGYELLLNGELM